MEYKRYILSSYDQLKWVRCIDCSTPDEPCYVWEGRDRSVNFAQVIGAVMHHEIRFHPSQLPRR